MSHDEIGNVSTTPRLDATIPEVLGLADGAAEGVEIFANMNGGLVRYVARDGFFVRSRATRRSLRALSQLLGRLGCACLGYVATRIKPTTIAVDGEGLTDQGGDATGGCRNSREGTGHQIED